MWISILNYAAGQIEVADIEDMEATAWLKANNFKDSEVSYMVTEEEPDIYDHNTQNYIDMPL